MKLYSPQESGVICKSTISQDWLVLVQSGQEGTQWVESQRYIYFCRGKNGKTQGEIAGMEGLDCRLSSALLIEHRSLE